jgi:hypothetical protein
MGEEEVVTRIKGIADESRVDIRYEFRDIQRLLDDDLMRRFIQKLEKTPDGAERKRQIRDIAIKAVMGSRR